MATAVGQHARALSLPRHADMAEDCHDLTPGTPIKGERARDVEVSPASTYAPDDAAMAPTPLSRGESPGDDPEEASPSVLTATSFESEFEASKHAEGLREDSAEDVSKIPHGQTGAPRAAAPTDGAADDEAHAEAAARVAPPRGRCAALRREVSATGALLEQARSKLLALAEPQLRRRSKSLPEQGRTPPARLDVPPTEKPSDRPSFLPELIGTWRILDGDETAICRIRADGSILYDGRHMGDEYDLVEDDSSGEDVIRRCDGWALDMEGSSEGLLVWAREGMATVQWMRIPNMPSQDTRGSGAAAADFSAECLLRRFCPSACGLLYDQRP